MFFPTLGLVKCPTALLLPIGLAKRAVYFRCGIFSRGSALLPSRLLASLVPKIGLAKKAASIWCEIFSLVVGHAALRLFSLSCPKTLGALCCARVRHPVSACLSQAVRLCALSCGSLPSLLGSGSPLFWPKNLHVACLWRLPTLLGPFWAGNGFPVVRLFLH